MTPKTCIKSEQQQHSTIQPKKNTTNQIIPTLKPRIDCKVIISLASFTFRIADKLLDTESNAYRERGRLGIHFKEISNTLWT